jgi:hypothetical protein
MCTIKRAINHITLIRGLQMKHLLFLSTLSASILALSSPLAWAEHPNQGDCSHAQEDIAHLQHEKKSTDERKMKGVLAITPLGLVVNATSGDDTDSSKAMEINEYNSKIDERITEIQKNCNL